MCEKNKDNYQALCDRWRRDFLTWDHAARLQNLGIGTMADGKIVLDYYNEPYRINLQTGQIRCDNRPNEAVCFNTQMALYHLFYYAKAHPQNAGRWVPFRGVRGAAPFDRAFKKNVRDVFAGFFNGRTALLKKTGKQLGFEPIEHHGDAAFLVKAFACMPMQFIFWDGDEELSPEFNILFDYNITDFTHEETVVLIAEDGVRRFIEAAGGTMA